MATKYVWLNDKGHVIGNKDTVCYTEQCPCSDPMWCPGIKIKRYSIIPGKEPCKAEYTECIIRVEAESESGKKTVTHELLSDKTILDLKYDSDNEYIYFVVQELGADADCADCNKEMSQVCFPGIDSSFSSVTLAQLYRAALYEIAGVEWQVPTSFMPQTLDISCDATDKVKYTTPSGNSGTNNIINKYTVSYYVKNIDGYLEFIRPNGLFDNQISVDGGKTYYTITNDPIPQFISVKNVLTASTVSETKASDLCFNDKYQDTWQFRLTAEPVTSGLLQEDLYELAWDALMGCSGYPEMDAYIEPTICELKYYTKYLDFAKKGKLFSISLAGGSNTQEEELGELPKPIITDGQPECAGTELYLKNDVSGTIKMKLTSTQIVTITGSGKSRTLTINKDGGYSIKVEQAVTPLSPDYEPLY